MFRTALVSMFTMSIVSANTWGTPSIDSIEPAFGEIGSEITINGSNFSPNDIGDVVFFGGLKADVLSAAENELIVSVPAGVYSTPISVYTNGLFASSSQRFNVVFDAAEEFTVAHLSNQLHSPYLGAKYYDARIADMNGDGVAEIVTSEAGEGSSAYLAIFTTSFDSEGVISIDDKLHFNFGTGVYSQPQDIAIGDINGDGLLDVVVSEKGDVTDDFQAHTCIFINTSRDGSFSFNAPFIISGDGYEDCVQLQDINGDGKLDLVTTRYVYNQIGVYINTSDSKSMSFDNKIIIEDVLAYERPAFADLNGDGMVDVVTTAYSTSISNREVFVYSNNSEKGDIDFSLEATILSGGPPPNGGEWNWSALNPTLADIDGDGKLDIAVANGTCGNCSLSGISVIRNVSTDSELLFEYEFSDFYQYQSQSLPIRIHVSDLNGDGKPDLLTNDWMGGISIITNASTPENISLDEQMIIGIGNFPLSVVAADLNMDATPEIVVTNWEVEGMRILHNFLPVSNCNTAGDINADGVVSVADLHLVIDQWGLTDSPADINGDGIVNVSDLLIVIDNWGACE